MHSNQESVFECHAERERLVAGALSWLIANLSRFEPPFEPGVFNTPPEKIVQGRARKAFGELGLFLRLAHRSPALRERSEILSLTSSWLEMAHSQRIFFDARRRVRLVPLMAVALTVMNDLDSVPVQARNALQAVLDREFIDRTELSAWSKVDIMYYFDTLGLQHGFPSVDVLLRQSSLLVPPALCHAQRMDLYAVTHLVFHLTDFGMRPLPGATPDEVYGVCDYLALALAMSLAEEDFDLVGEFLISLICIGKIGDPLSHFSTKVLLESQQPAGFIPDRSWLRGLKGEEEKETEEFFAVYHPTLVALIVAACDTTPRCGDVRHLV
jgi:hypothetical protein